MIPYIGDYIEHIDGSIDNFKYFTFTPRPLMHGDMYKMDDELSTFLIEAHRNIGILKGLFKYAPNREAFVELMLLKECTYSRMIDYDTLTFHDVLASRGSGKNAIASINNLKLAYKKAIDRALCGIALYGDAVSKPVDIRAKQIFYWVSGRTLYLTTLQPLTQFYQCWPIFPLIYIMPKTLIR